MLTGCELLLLRTRESYQAVTPSGISDVQLDGGRRPVTRTPRPCRACVSREDRAHRMSPPGRGAINTLE